MKAKGLDQIVDKIAMAEESVEIPYLVFDALQTFKTHHLNKELHDSPLASALVSTASSSFPSKTLHYGGNGQHNPLATTHTEDRCFHKFPHLKEEFYKRQNKKPTNASASFSHATVLMTTTLPPNCLFVLDSAASHHMIRDCLLFTNLTVASIKVRTGDPNTPLVSEGYGTASIISGGRVITLSNALFVPRISQQLISLVQLLDKLITIAKDGDTFQVLSSRLLLFEGKIKDNLLFASASKPSAFLAARSNSSMLWHHCLGHPSNAVLQELRLPLPKSDDCSVCSCSKMTLLPFSSHFSSALFPLHRLHLDLVGPVNPSSVSGFRYFMTCVDQFSSFKFVCFLKSKADALDKFKKLLDMVENKQGTTVKEVVSDRGGKFVNQAFKAFTSARGIKHVLAPPYTPEHNGFAERANCTVIKKARCILMTSKLPRSYWAEAVNTAAFVSNMLPTASCGNVSPYELWTKSPPPMSRLRTFGCLAYITVRKAHRLWKFGATGERGIFVGYENNGTTFRIVRHRDMKLVPTRHTRFSELDFPGISDPLGAIEDLDFNDDDFFDCLPTPASASPPVAVADSNSAPSTPAATSSLPEFVTPPCTPPLGALAPAAPLPL
jgi:hypothetical protein